MELCNEHMEPMGIKSVLGCGWRVVVENWRSLAVICVLIYLPLGFLDALVDFGVDEFAVGIGKVAGFFLDLAGMVAVAILTSKALDGEAAGAKDVLRSSFRKIPAAFIASFVAGIIVMLLMLLLIVPGVIWAVYYTFILQAVALRDMRGKQALDYSKSLVTGRWLDVFGTALVVGIVTSVPVFATFLALLALSIIVPAGGKVFMGVSYTLLYIVMLYYIICMTVYFLNLERLVYGNEEPVHIPEYLREGLDRLSSRPDET